MLPIENKPDGSQKRNDLKKEPDQDRDSAINSAKNLPPEEKEDSEDESASDADGKGTVGDFAKPEQE
ncbi:MAG: hypothetical protein EOP00_13860 [Pedobacter sp.]|nr:MAG: hypothetical protein EOP00_13860 [Pedobacter sp.]